MRNLLFVLLLCLFGNVASLSFAENIEKDSVAVNEVQKDILVENVDNNNTVFNNIKNSVENDNSISVKTENAASTKENIEIKHIDVIDNGSAINVPNAGIENNDKTKTDNKVSVIEDATDEITIKKKPELIMLNAGVDLYFSIGGNVFTDITGVDSYKAGNRFYSFGVNQNFSLEVRNGLYVFTGFGIRADFFDKVSKGVSSRLMSPSVGFYGMFGMKIIMSKYFSIEPYINLGGLLLNNGKIVHRSCPRRSAMAASAVGMMTAFGVDCILFKMLIVGLELQYNMFSRDPFNAALSGIGYDSSLLSQNRWQHNLAAVVKIGFKIDTVYLEQ